MVVSIDKATAIRTYDKVQKYWQEYLKDLRKRLKESISEEERVSLQEKVSCMEQTDMAVVVSPSQNESEDMAKKGLDIASHRRRMDREDLEDKFKDPADPFRIVFVCAMWMTGFDVPSVSTIYLDKPMRNHTLMQTIARANRVYNGKQNGLIVDYVGVFQNLEEALAVYASDAGRKAKEGETPVKDKEKLAQRLRDKVRQTEEFFRERGLKPDDILKARGLELGKLLADAQNSVLKNDETKNDFLALSTETARLFKAILPDRTAQEFFPFMKFLSVLTQRVRNITSDPGTDISELMEEVDRILDESVTARNFVIPDSRDEQEPIDLSRVDFDELAQKFERKPKYTEAERLRGAVSGKLQEMVKLNKTRTDYEERLQDLIDKYNQGSLNLDVYYRELLKFTRDLMEEDKRTISEGLTEEELAVFDLLTKPEMSLTDKDKKQIKKVSKNLLNKLKTGVLTTISWREKQQARAQAQSDIREELGFLPATYLPDVRSEKRRIVYQHVYESYFGDGESIYGEAV